MHPMHRPISQCREPATNARCFLFHSCLEMRQLLFTDKRTADARIARHRCGESVIKFISHCRNRRKNRKRDKICKSRVSQQVEMRIFQQHTRPDREDKCFKEINSKFIAYEDLAEVLRVCFF